MKFEQIETSVPHRVYKVTGISGKYVLHDTTGFRYPEQNVVDAALEAFGLSGSMSQQLNSRRSNEDGLMLQTTKINHAIVASVNKNIVVSSTGEITTQASRKIAKAFMAMKEE